MRIAVIGALLLALSSVAMAGGEEKVPLVGLDNDNQPVELFVKKSSLQNKLTGSINAVEASTASALETRQVNTGWSLRTVVVGISVSLEAGITKVLKLGVVPRFRVAFSNSKEAVLP